MIWWHPSPGSSVPSGTPGSPPARPRKGRRLQRRERQDPADEEVHPHDPYTYAQSVTGT